MTTTNEGARRPEDRAMDKIRDEMAGKGIGPGETALGEYLTEHVGSADYEAVEGCVRMTISYVFGGTTCVVCTAVEALKAIGYVDCGFLQATPSAIPDGSNWRLYRYVNNVGSGHAFSSAQLKDVTGDTAGYSITAQDLADTDAAVNRMVDIVTNSGGTMLHGFTFGYIPDISSGRDGLRKSLASQWSIRKTTKKSYPVCLLGEDADEGYYADIIGYRNYLPPGELTNETRIEIGGSLYVIVDAHTQQTNRCVAVPDKYMGHTVTVLESVNFTLQSQIVGAKGVVFSTNAAYGCAVLKIV